MISRVVCAALAMWGVSAVVATDRAAAADEKAPAKLQIRNFDHLEFDTVTGTYLGIAGFYTKDEKVVFNQGGKVEQETATAELRLLMGGESFQGGVAIPYHTTSGDGLGGGESDIGDVRAHVKFIPLRKDLFDLGAGLMLTFPGDADDVGISSTAIGVLPFATGTVHAGPVDVNGHIGYDFINHDSPTGAPESILYGGSVTYPVLDMLGLRLEIAGQQYTSGDDRNVVAIEPGIDVLIPVGCVDLQLSASGAYGLSGGLAGGAVGSEPGFGSRWGVNSKSGLSRGEWGAGAAIGVLWN